METPFMPSWNRVVSAIPSILDDLKNSVDEDSKNYGLGHGAELYLTKPFKVDDLLKKVGEVLNPGGPEPEKVI